MRKKEYLKMGGGGGSGGGGGDRYEGYVGYDIVYLPVLVGKRVYFKQSSDLIQEAEIITIELNGSDEMGGGFFAARYKADGDKYVTEYFCLSDVGRTVFKSLTELRRAEGKEW